MDKEKKSYFNVTRYKVLWKYLKKRLALYHHIVTP